ncbi:unnamed protein product, partial [Dicrocoelium dendriticum]
MKLHLSLLATYRKASQSKRAHFAESEDIPNESSIPMLSEVDSGLPLCERLSLHIQ